MITLIAIDDRSGSAIAKQESGEYAILNINSDVLTPVPKGTEKDVKQLIEDTSFEACNITYYNMADALKMLTEKHIEYIKNVDVNEFVSPDMILQLCFMSTGGLQSVLKEIENFIIPTGRKDIAKAIASAVMKNVHIHDEYSILDAFRDIR
jgi:hypothetical protein